MIRTSPSLTSSNIISKVYNCIKPPTKALKCSVCANQQIEKQLQLTEGRNYVCIPDRHVEIYVCGFCQNLSQPRCKHCFNRQACCTYKERIQYNDYFSQLKKQIIKAVTAIGQTFKLYEDRSMRDLTFPETSFISPSSINMQLMVYLADVQYKLKKQVQQKIQRNQKQLFQIYKQFESQVVCKLYPYSPQGLERYKADLGIDATKNMSLQDCTKFLKEIQKYKETLQQMGYDICDKYIQKVNIEYPKQLYHRLNQAFRQFLFPKVTYKEALIQTTDTHNFGSSHSIGSQKSPKQEAQQTAGAIMIQQKVTGLQKVIQKNFQTMRRLEDRIKDLEFVVQVQQTKNQDLDLKLIQFETKHGIGRKDKDISMTQDYRLDSCSKAQYSRVTYKSINIKSGLKSSKSDPNILKNTQIIQKQKLGIKTYEQPVPVPDQNKSYVKSQVAKLKKPRKESQGKKSSKDRSQLNNSSWLQQVVNQINQ